MIKNLFSILIFSGLILFLLEESAFSKENAVPNEKIDKTSVLKEISIQSIDLSVDLKIVDIPGGQKILMSSLKDRKNSAEYTVKDVPFFVLPVRKEGTKDPIWISSQSTWQSVKITREKNGGLCVFSNPKELSDGNSATVKVCFEIRPDQPGIHMTWRGSLSDKKLTFTSGFFPKMNFKCFGEKIKGFKPSLSGEVSDDVYNGSFRYYGNYPNGFGATMPWFAFWDSKSKNGIFFANLDPEGNAKNFTMKSAANPKDPTPNQIDFLCEAPFENYGVPGNSFEGFGEFYIRTFQGDWYDAAMIYRDWVRKNAKWYPTLTEEGRADIPLWMKENCVFLMASSDPRWLTPNRRVFTPVNKMADTLHAFRDAVGVPGAVHWYLWHQNPYDNDYPHFFPAKKGFDQEVLKVQKDNDFRVMPYTNGRLWDTHDRGKEDWKFTKEGLPGAIKREDGSIKTESYALEHTGREADGTPCIHAIMCPGSDVWAKKIRENVLTAMNRCNVQAVYVDQVGAATVTPCFDSKHNHRPGGGHWWLENGYWKIFQQIRKDMRREVADIPFNPTLKKMIEKNPKLLQERIIVTECNAEVYNFCVDGFLTWHWQSQNQVPAFPAIYGGTVCMLGRTSTGNALSVKMRVCEALTFGEQIGWFDPNVKDDPEKFPFIRDAIRLRYQIRPYFYKGEMARCPTFIDPMPKTSAEWLWGKNPNLNTKDSVRTSIWRILDFEKKQKGIESLKSAVLIFSNVSDRELKNKIQFDRKELGLKGNKYHVRQIDSDGVVKDNLPLSILDEPITFPAEKSFALEIIPD